MPDSVPLTHELVKLSHSAAVVPIEPQQAKESVVFDDEVIIQIAPNRRAGTINVRLAYAGRSVPLPADDPWAE
jgi:hypothetical protein